MTRDFLCYLCHFFRARVAHSVERYIQSKEQQLVYYLTITHWKTTETFLLDKEKKSAGNECSFCVWASYKKEDHELLPYQQSCLTRILRDLFLRFPLFSRKEKIFISRKYFLKKEYECNRKRHTFLLNNIGYFHLIFFSIRIFNILWKSG